MQPPDRPSCFSCNTQFGDLKALVDNRTQGASLYGATDFERATVIGGKLAHYGLLLVVPWLLHGPQAALVGGLAYSITQSIVLSATFAVSHNVPESKPLDQGQTQVREPPSYWASRADVLCC